MTHNYTLLIGILAILIFPLNLITAQSIKFQNKVPGDVKVCLTEDGFKVKFQNKFGATIYNVFILVEFPSGVEYDGNFETKDDYPVSEHDLNDLSNPWFLVDNLPKGKRAEFTFNGIANPAIFSNPNDLLNHVTVYYQDALLNGTNWYYFEDEDTDEYGYKAAILEITEVDPLSNSVITGNSFSRIISVKNVGDEKISAFSIFDNHNPDLSITEVDYGVLNPAGNQISFSTEDLESLGNGNGFFDENETITVVEQVLATGCASVQSEIFAQYGCSGEFFISNKSFPFTTIQSPNPDLSVQAFPSFNTCNIGGYDEQNLLITNTGAGTANDIKVDVFQYAQENYEDILSKIDINNIYYQLNNGGFQHIIPSQTYNTNNSNEFSCLGNNAKGRIILDLPDLSGGSSYTIRWSSITCIPDFCGDMDLTGWKYDISYTDYCENQNLTVNGIGQESQGKAITVINDYPANMIDGDLKDFIFHLSAADVQLPAVNGAFVKAHFVIPPELTVVDINNSLIFTKNGLNWAPDFIDYTNGNLVATYPLPAPWAFSDAKIRLALGLDCNATSPPIGDGIVEVSLNLDYVMNGACENLSAVPLICETVSTNLQCIGICAKGMDFEDFTVERTSFGLPDNDENGLPDNGGALNMNTIALNRVMKGDTFKTVFEGIVNTSFNVPVFSYGYAKSELTHGAYLNLTGATLSVQKALTGQTITCNSIDYTSIIEDGLLKCEFDISIPSLLANACSEFIGYQYQEGDLVTLTPEYEVIENIGATVENVLIDNEFYLSLVPDPLLSEQFSCGNKSGNISIIGYEYTISDNENISLTECEKRVSKTLKLGVGACCDDAAWTDIFPSEFRNFAHLNNASIIVPPGYSVQNAFLSQTSFGGAYVQNHPVSATNINGNLYSIDLSSAYTNNGGFVNPADESFTGEIFVDLIADCNVEQDLSQSLSWSCNFLESAGMGGNPSQNLSGADLLTFERSEIQINTSIQTVQGIEKTVSWEVELANTSLNVDADNVWLNLSSPSGLIEVTEVIDLSNNLEIYPSGEIYQLSTLVKNSSKNYRITAVYDNCSLDLLEVKAGYECDGYPLNMDQAFCNYNTFELKVDPRPASFSAEMSTRTEENDITTYNTVELDVTSTGEAFLKDIQITLEMPASQGLTLQQDSAWIEYVIGSGYAQISTPALINDEFIFSDDLLHVDLYKNGLPGLSNPSANRFKLKFNITFQGSYESGDEVIINIDAKSACGEQLPTIEYRLDPNQIYTPISGIGVDGGGNNWGVSWADYDKDGDPDLFITNYDVDQPNELYNNQGDGTFVKVTTGQIAIDAANSVGSSWGDYDNDGDLDLFVTNTIGFKNFLYRNNGDGTFFRIQDDPVVNYTDYSHGVSWGDYDNDGYLDLFVTDFFSTKFNLLYHNNGDGTFTRITSSAVVTDANSSTSASWIDIDNDGDLDLFVANTNNENNLLYKNEGNGNFQKITTGAIVNDGGKSVGGSWGDIDNDGDYDLYVTNAGGQNNFLYLNNGDGTFIKNTADESANSGGNSHGSSMGDFDNDGDLDLVVTNDAGEDNLYFVNDGNGNFKSVDNLFSSSGGESFAVASADFDMDRDLDLYVVNHGNNTNFFYRNDRNISKNIVNYNQASINLQGVLSNAIAIGARISVMFINNGGQEVWQTRQVSGQTGGGLSSQNDILQHFGLGNASQIDSMVIEWPSGYVANYGPQVTGSVLNFVEPSGAELSGIVYFDENGNGNYNNGEITLPNAEIVIQPGNLSVYTNAVGEYSVNLAPGSYTISQNPMNNWNLTSGVGGLNVNINNPNGNYSGFDFGNEPSTGLPEPDLEVALSSTALRIGFESLFALSYGNIGTADGEDVTLEIDFGPDIIPLNASVPWDNVSGNVYSWDLGTVGIGERNTIYIYDSVSVNAVIGNLSAVSATISSSNNDLDLSNNSTIDNSPFIGAFDPNDILVFPEGEIKRDEVLTYKIRFQNVGNAPVERVEVRNLLPGQLDIKKLVIGAVSHPYRFRIENGNELIWTFENIYLPDSIADEVNSHGFITYRVQPVENATNGMEIKNNASIFFDNNDPIITNTVVNTILDLNFAERGKLMIYPNPMISQATIEIIPKSLRLQNVEIKKLMIFDALGRLVYKRNDISNYKYQIEKEKLKEGYFVVKAIGEDGNEYIGQVIIK